MGSRGVRVLVEGTTGAVVMAIRRVRRLSAPNSSITYPREVATSVEQEIAEIKDSAADTPTAKTSNAKPSPCSPTPSSPGASPT